MKGKSKTFTISSLRKLGPCQDGLDFAESQPSLAAAWDNCKRPDWMFWILEQVAPLAKEQSVRLAIAFAKQALPQYVACYPDDDCLAKSIAAAEAWISDPTEANRSAAWSAASAARSAAQSAARSAARSAAESAAWSAASAAESAASAAESAASAAESAAESAQADIIRSIVANPFKKGK